MHSSYRHSRGKETEPLGWASLSPNRYSASCTYPQFLKNPRKKYRLDARIKGGQRAIIMSNEYDKVFPMDIFPEQLVKATIAFNIEKMENLGIYEIAPEDFALCGWTPRNWSAKIIRTGLDSLQRMNDALYIMYNNKMFIEDIKKFFR